MTVGNSGVYMTSEVGQVLHEIYRLEARNQASNLTLNDLIEHLKLKENGKTTNIGGSRYGTTHFKYKQQYFQL